MTRLLVVLLVALLATPGGVFAQSAPAQPIDVSKLGVSLDRIRRELHDSASQETVNASGFKLRIRIDVFGEAPPIDLIPKDFSLTQGPVPHSAPTHREYLEMVTPKEFRAPVVPIFGVAVWAAQKLAERSKRSQCEEEIANYRALVMQGVAVAAPQCSK